MEYADLIAIFGLAVGVFLTFYQLRKGNIQNRAQFIVNLLTQHTSDPEVLEILYKIEYDKWIFDSECFENSADERGLDKLLYSFEQISALYELGTIAREDIQLIEYDFLRVYLNAEVQKYFEYLAITPHRLPTNRADFITYRNTAYDLVKEFEKKHHKVGKWTSKLKHNA